jgi:hypothetical protein
VDYVLLNFRFFHLRTTWPVGAMVARSPPKAEAVGSSPTSVAYVPLPVCRDHASFCRLLAYVFCMSERTDLSLRPSRAQGPSRVRVTIGSSS